MGVGVSSGSQKILEPLLAQLGIAGGVLNGAVAEPVLNGPRFVRGVSNSFLSPPADAGLAVVPAEMKTAFWPGWFRSFSERYAAMLAVPWSKDPPSD